MEKAKVLDQETLDKIKPFTGEPGPLVPMPGRTLQQIKTEYITAIAVQKPRSITLVTANVMFEAKLAGAGFYYRWMVKNRETGKKSPVQGASIDLAMCVARNYGNCAVPIECVDETPTHFMLKATFVDLETGFTVPRLFRQRKKQNMGSGFDPDRAEDIAFQIGQSKAQRNAILKAAPGWLVDQAIEVAKIAELDSVKVEAPAIARAKVITFFETHGISLDRIEAEIDNIADNWTAQEIVDLRAMATALNEGRITANELFPKIREPENTPENKKVAEKEKIDPMAGAANEPDGRKGHMGGETPQKTATLGVKGETPKGTQVPDAKEPDRNAEFHAEDPPHKPIPKKTSKSTPKSAPKKTGSKASKDDKSQDGASDEGYAAEFPNIRPDLFSSHPFKELCKMMKDEMVQRIWMRDNLVDKPMLEEKTITQTLGYLRKQAQAMQSGQSVNGGGR